MLMQFVQLAHRSGTDSTMERLQMQFEEHHALHLHLERSLKAFHNGRRDVHFACYSVLFYTHP